MSGQNSTSSGRQGNNCAFRSSRNIKGYLCSPLCHWAVLLFLLTSFVWLLNDILCQNAADLVNVVMFLLTVKYRGLMRESSFLSHTHIKSPLGSSVSCLTWNANWRLYSLYHTLALYCKSWQNWLKIWLWVLFHGHFIKISLNISCTSGFFIKPLFWKLAHMFYSASRDWDPYILLNSFNLMLQFAMAFVHSLAVNLSAGKQAVF